MDQHDRKAWRKGSVYAADFRPLDRNQRAKILFLAEAMDRRTHKPGQHAGFLGRTGLAVLRALIVRFHNVKTGRLDPSYEAIAKAANVARSTAQEAIARLELAGIVDHVRRIARVRVRVFDPSTGRVSWRDRVVQMTNAYRLNVPVGDRSDYGDLAKPCSKRVFTDTDKRSETPKDLFSMPTLDDLPPGKLRSTLESLRDSIVPRDETSKQDAREGVAVA